MKKHITKHFFNIINHHHASLLRWKLVCFNAGSETDDIGGKCPYCDGICHVEFGTASGKQLGVARLYQRIICFKCERQRLAIPRPPTPEAGQDVLASAVEDDDNMAEDEVVVGGEVVDVTLPLVPPVVLEETPARPSGQPRHQCAPTCPRGQPSISVEAIRGKMNLENVKHQTRATKTLDTHRREIEKLVLWFYDNMNNLIGEEFRATLKLK
jgi:hypothetical protein